MASTTITLPELGEGVDSVDVVAVLVAVGDTVVIDQGLIEVETEKASVEVPSTTAGTVTEVHVKEGDVLGENAPIVTLDATESEAPPADEPRCHSAASSPPELLAHRVDHHGRQALGEVQCLVELVVDGHLARLVDEAPLLPLAA